MVAVGTLGESAENIHTLVLKIVGNGISTILRKLLVCISGTLR